MLGRTKLQTKAVWANSRSAWSAPYSGAVLRPCVLPFDTTGLSERSLKGVGATPGPLVAGAPATGSVKRWPRTSASDRPAPGLLLDRSFHAARNPGAGQDLTGLAAAVQLRLRVAVSHSGLQTLTVKLRLLPGWNTVRVRGNPAFAHDLVAGEGRRAEARSAYAGRTPLAS